MAVADAPWTPPLYLYAAGRHSVNSRTYYNEPASRHLLCRRVLIQRTLSGEGVLFGCGKKFVVPAGWMFIIERPGAYGYCYQGDGSPWELEYASICCETPHPLIPPLCMESPLVPLERHPGLGDAVSGLVNSFHAGESPLVLAEKSYRLLLGAIHALQYADSRKPWVEELRQCIENEFATGLSFALLARVYGITQETMIRSFKRAYGLPPAQYLLRVRLRHARRFLEETRDPLKQVAAACGFSDANYFGRLFRRELGCTPAQYRLKPNPLLER